MSNDMDRSGKTALNMDDLSAVIGGAQDGSSTGSSKNATKDSYCPKCGKMMPFRLGSGGRAFCMECNFEKLL